MNGWVNKREARDLRRHRAHYDVTIMYIHDKGRALVILWFYKIHGPSLTGEQRAVLREEKCDRDILRMRCNNTILGTITNDHHLWWSNQELSTYLLCAGYKTRLTENIWWSIGWTGVTKRMVIHLIVHFTRFFVSILAKFYHFTSSFEPNIYAKSIVAEFTARDRKYCWWSLYWKLVPSDD